MWDPSSVAGHLAPLDRIRRPVTDLLDVVPAPILCDLDLELTWEPIDRVDALPEAAQR
jgi:hypothetical protein